MGKPINEKFSGIWRVLWAFAAVPFAFMVLVSLVTGNLDALEMCALTIGLVIGFGVIIQRISRPGRPMWLINDEGLIRYYASGGQKKITWEQIQDMKYVRYIGLIFRWNEPQPGRNKQVLYAEVRENIGVQEDEAKELISLWQKRPSTMSGESLPIKKVPNKSDVLRGGKLIFAGFIGLINPFIIIFPSLFGCRQVTLNDIVGESGLIKLVTILNKLNSTKVGESCTPADEVGNHYFKLNGKWVVLVVEEYKPIKLIAPKTVIEDVKTALKGPVLN